MLATLQVTKPQKQLKGKETMNTHTIKIDDTPELRFNPRIDSSYSGRVILGETRAGKTKLFSPEQQAEYKAAYELSEAEYASIKIQPK